MYGQIYVSHISWLYNDQVISGHDSIPGACHSALFPHDVPTFQDDNVSTTPPKKLKSHFRNVRLCQAPSIVICVSLDQI